MASCPCQPEGPLSPAVLTAVSMSALDHVVAKLAEVQVHSFNSPDSSKSLILVTV